MGMNWRLAFTVALVQGILFTALSVSPFRRQLLVRLSFTASANFSTNGIQPPVESKTQQAAKE